jgi:stage II sporulation protein D
VVALWTAACVVLPPPHARTLEVHDGSRQTPEHAVPEPPDVWHTRGLVPVRVAAHEQARVLFVEVDGEHHRLARRGDGVALDDGSVEPFVVVGARTGTLELEGVDHGRAELVAVPHPVQGLRVELWLDLEAYVEGVVAAELVLWDAPAAQLEAQAIAARSYAVGTLDRRARAARAFLWDGVEDQAYRGPYVPDAAATKRGIATRLTSAARATSGQVLTWGGRAADVRFHASCGGHTAPAIAIFGPGTAGGTGTATCPGCAVQGGWSRHLDRAALDAAARTLGLEHLGRPVATSSDPSGRWLEVELRDVRGVRPVPANELRRAVGWTALPSTWITTWTEHPDGSADVTGRGRGHGVGLCQEGAGELARRGFGAHEILGHYYPGARLTRVVSVDARRTER